MNNLTTEELTNWIKEQSKVFYPDFFDDDRQANMTDALVNSSLAFIGDRSKHMSAMTLKEVGLYMTLMMMWQLDHLDGNPSDVKAGSIQVELQNAQNPFAQTLGMWLDRLGWNLWGCSFL